MKRLAWGLLILYITISLCSCSNGQEKDTYVPPDGIDLVYIGVGAQGNNILPFIENTSEHVIKNLKIATAQFDRNGFFVFQSILEYTSVNLLPNENKILSGPFGSDYATKSSEVQYISGAIASVEFMDGSIWESKSIESWIKNAESGVDVSQKKLTIENMQDLANKATSNSYINLRVSCPTPNDTTWGTINYIADIVGNGVVSSFTITALCFDENGFPVNTGGGKFATNSISYQDSDIYRAKGNYVEGYFEWVMNSGQGIKSVKSIISEISFADGSMWKNEYATYWELYYGDVIGI